MGEVTLPTSSGLAVTVDGAPLAPELRDKVIEARLEESLYVPSEFTIRLEDDDAEAFDSGVFAPGMPVDLSFGSDDIETVLSRAEITRVSMAWDDGGGVLEVGGLDRGHRLAQGVVVQTFVALTDAEIATRLASLHGLTAEVDASPVTHEYMLVATDAYAWLTERAHAIGFEWWVTAGVLYFKAASTPPTKAPLTLVRGEGLVQFRLRQSAAAIAVADGYVVRGWSPAEQLASVGTGDGTSLPPMLAGTTAPARARFTEAMTSSGAFSGAGFSGALPVSTPDEATALATSLAQRAAAEQLRASGEAMGNPALRAGCTVTLAGLGEQASGDYTLTNVVHVIPGAGDYVVRFKAGGADEGTLVDLLGARDAATLPAWGENGLVPAVVTNTLDEDKTGRIKVRFPTLGDEDESAWARVLAIGAGNGRGLAIPYEVGDEVYVAFEHGDTRRPVVVGAVWSKALPPPVTSDLLYGPDNLGLLTVWQTRSGHKIELQDSETPAESFVRITLADTTTVLRLGADAVSLASPSPVTITTDMDLSVTATGALSLTGQSVSITATDAITLNGDSVSADATSTVSLTGMDMEANAQKSLTLGSTGEAALTGTLVKVN